MALKNGEKGGGKNWGRPCGCGWVFEKMPKSIKMLKEKTQDVLQ